MKYNIAKNRGSCVGRHGRGQGGSRPPDRRWRVRLRGDRADSPPAGVDGGGAGAGAVFHADRSDHDGPYQACDCGGEARYAGCTARTVTTLVGTIRLVRAYDHRETCGRGCHTLGRALGLAESALSAGAVRMTGRATAATSFARAGELLRKLAGLRVGARQGARGAPARLP